MKKEEAKIDNNLPVGGYYRMIRSFTPKETEQFIKDLKLQMDKRNEIKNNNLLTRGLFGRGFKALK